MAEQFVYAVTRVHIHEQGLLSKQDVDALLAAPNVGEVYRMLGDKGWGGPEVPENDPNALVAAESRKTWDLIGELIGDVSEFNVFRYANDYHNLKAAIKLAYSGNEEKDQSRYFLSGGTVDVELIQKAAAEHNFDALPEEMAKAAKQAYETLAHTGNGQACDMIIDSAALVAIDKAGRETKNELLRRYAEITVDSANIKAAVRCCLMGKSREFIEKAIAPAGTLEAKQLINAAADSLNAVYSYLRTTKYADAVDELEKSMAAFERWGDNQMMEMIRPQRHNYFGIEPLAAYILGRENEIAIVRLILSAKMNNLDADAVRERVRETYV